MVCLQPFCNANSFFLWVVFRFLTLTSFALFFCFETLLRTSTIRCFVTFVCLFIKKPTCESRHTCRTVFPWAFVAFLEFWFTIIFLVTASSTAFSTTAFSTTAFSTLTELYRPKSFLTHAELLDQAFAHCPIFPTAASRRSLDRVSVPVWRIILSDPLYIVALVGHYPTN